MLDSLEFLLPSSSLMVLVSVLILCSIIMTEYRRNSGLPPGPCGLPWIGYLPWMDMKHVSQQLSALCHQYHTDILSITVLGGHFIVLNTHELAKEVFQKRNDAIGRAHYRTVVRATVPCYSGVLVNMGRQWREGRRLSIASLKQFGMGRTGAETVIQNEAKILCEKIKLERGEAVDPESYLSIAVSNIICCLVFGQRFNETDEEFVNALDGMNKFMKRFNSQVGFMILQLRLFREFLLKREFHQITQDLKDYTQFVKDRIQEHRENYNGQNTDLIYSFLREMEEGRDPEVFDDAMLESVISDFFLGGSETTYTTLRWCLLVLAGHPDVYKKVREEIDQVLGDREPSMMDKKHTPYCEAFINEVQRHFTLGPIGMGHSNDDGDIDINGYRIPQGSFIVANLDHMHHDETIWKNASVFDPENFLEKGKVVNTEKLVTFGIGRRACAGEALARMELYLFFMTMVKNFDIKLETDDTRPDFEGNHGAVFQPKSFKLRMISIN